MKSWKLTIVAGSTLGLLLAMGTEPTWGGQKGGRGGAGGGARGGQSRVMSGNRSLTGSPRLAKVGNFSNLENRGNRLSANHTSRVTSRFPVNSGLPTKVAKPTQHPFQPNLGSAVPSRGTGISHGGPGLNKPTLSAPGGLANHLSSGRHLANTSNTIKNPTQVGARVLSVSQRTGLAKVAKQAMLSSTLIGCRRYLGLAPLRHVVHCHYGNWWFRYAYGWHLCHNRPWYYQAGYWNCWVPCSYRVVTVPGCVYTVGLECIQVPDVACLGVQSVHEGSPAERAGLLEGDLIVAINGRQPEDQSVLEEEVRQGTLSLEIMREGSEEPLTVALVPERQPVE